MNKTSRSRAVRCPHCKFYKGQAATWQELNTELAKKIRNLRRQLERCKKRKEQPELSQEESNIMAGGLRFASY